MRIFDADIRAVLDALGLQSKAAVTTQRLAAGAYHEHAVLQMDGRSVVLRRCLDSQWGLSPAVQLARERSTLEALRPTGLAPTPYALVLDAPGGPLLVEELVIGRPFAYAQDLPALGEALAEVHGLRPSHLPGVDARDELLADGRTWLERAGAHGAAAAPLAGLRQLEERAAPTSEAGAGTLVHTDLNAGNLVVEHGGRCRLLDWEAARIGDPAWDLAHALSPTTTLWDAGTACVLTAVQARSFLDAYAKRAADGGAAQQRLPELLDVVMFRALSWCLGFAAQACAREQPLPADLAATLARFGTPAFVEGCLGARARLGLG